MSVRLADRVAALLESAAEWLRERWGARRSAKCAALVQARRALELVRAGHELEGERELREAWKLPGSAGATWRELLELEGEVCESQGLDGEAVRCFEIAWAVAASAEDRVSQARLGARLGASRLQLGQVEAARHVLLASLKTLGGKGSEDRALEGLKLRLQHELAITELARGRPAEAFIWLVQALDLYTLPTESLREAERWWMQARIEAARARDLSHVDVAYRRAVGQFLELRQIDVGEVVLLEYLEFCKCHGRREVAGCVREFAAALSAVETGDGLQDSEPAARLWEECASPWSGDREAGSGARSVSWSNLRQLMAAARERGHRASASPADGWVH